MKILQKIISIFLYVVCAIALIISLFSVYQRWSGNQQPMIFGWGAAIVQTGSMEPNVPVGTLIIIHEEESYAVGDVVTYIDYRDWSITHRVISVTGDAGQYITTQGDANNVADPVFEKTAIVGRMVYMIEGVGSVVEWVQQPIVIGSIALLLIVCIVWDGVVRQKKRRELMRMFSVSKKTDLERMFTVSKQT